MTSGAKHRVNTKYTNGILTVDEVCLVILLLVVKITYFIELIIINPVYFQKFIRKDYGCYQGNLLIMKLSGVTSQKCLTVKFG